MTLSDSGLAEDQRCETVQNLVESAPDGVDIERLLAGSIAGPESAERPDVPVWEYVEYAATHPDVTLDDLGQVRFGIRSARGDTVPTSIDELLKPGPGPAAAYPTRRDIVHLDAAMHAAGLLRWDAATRTIVQVDPPSYDVAPVAAAWRHWIAGSLGSCSDPRRRRVVYGQLHCSWTQSPARLAAKQLITADAPAALRAATLAGICRLAVARVRRVDGVYARLAVSRGLGGVSVMTFAGSGIGAGLRHRLNAAES